MPRCLVALGANLGDREHTLEHALELLRASAPIASLAHSGWHETAPIGGVPGQSPFLNGAVCFDTTLSAEALHATLGRVEHALGRRRTERWAARTLDLDLLLYGDQIVNTPALVVPHPRMAFRRFVLQPAAEVAPDMVHPTIGWTIRRLAEHLDTAVPYVAVLGPPGSGKTALAEMLSRALGGRLVADPAANLPPPDTLDPPSREYQRQIQFLDSRAQTVNRQRWPTASVLAVSDFYLDQCLAYAKLELDADRFEAFCKAWRQASGLVVPPKLLVVVDPPPVGPAATGSSEGQIPSADPGASDRLGSQLLELASRREIGPVLYVGGLSRQAQFDEISAAIQAMQ